MDKVYVITLNWNSWQNTIECIGSVLNQEFPNLQLLVVDNASQDNSVEYIRDYLKKEGISYSVYLEEEVIEKENFKREAREKVIIIKNRENYGFAKGNNVAFKFILKRNDFDFIWLLNNDAIADKKALLHLVKVAKKRKKIGFVGSVIRYYSKPGYIQAVGGGKFYPLLGVGKLYMKNKSISILKHLDTEQVSRHINYIMGASLLIRKEVLENIGIFDESFFLYAEEMDLINRARKQGWELAVALDSYVFHKESDSTRDRKWLYYYHLSRSNIIFLKKHFGIYYTLTAAPFIILNTIRLTRKWENIKASIKGVINGIKSRGIQSSI